MCPLTFVESIASTSAQLPAAVGAPSPSPILVVGAGPRSVSATSTAPSRCTVKLWALTPARATDPSNLAATFGFDPLDNVVIAPNPARSTAAIQATRFVDSIDD